MQVRKYLLLSSASVFAAFADQPCAYLYGTMSSGKSSISARLAERDGWQVVASLYWSYLPALLKDRRPDIFADLSAVMESENITNAVLRNFLIFKDHSSEEQEEQAMKRLQEVRMLLNNDPNHMNEFKQFTVDYLKDAAKTNDSIVIDLSWYISAEEAQRTTEKAVMTFLVYCPLEDVVQRTILRNQEADANRQASNRRFICAVLSSFLNHYDLSESPAGAVDTLSKDAVLRCFELMEPYVPQERAERLFENLKNDILRRFEHKDTLHVVPRFFYDKLIETHKLSSNNAADKIAEYLHNAD